jgi:hypothetical protein
MSDPTRRTFVQGGAAAAIPNGAGRKIALSKCRRYGPYEKKALRDLIDSGKFYEELPALEGEWQAYTNASMPGNAQVNKTHIFLPLQYGEAPEIHDQWVKALEKVWAHEAELAAV